MKKHILELRMRESLNAVHALGTEPTKASMLQSRLHHTVGSRVRIAHSNIDLDIHRIAQRQTSYYR
jgi:hypothetical protein